MISLLIFTPENMLSEQELYDLLENEGISAGRALVKRVFLQYLGLPAYLRILLSRARGKLKEYDFSNIGGLCNLWADVLGPYYLGDRTTATQAKRSARICGEGDTVAIEDVTVSEWVPRLPGYQWTPTRERVAEILFPPLPEGSTVSHETMSYEEFSDSLSMKQIFEVYGNLETQIGSWGSVRFASHFGKRLIVGTTTKHGKISEGFPLIVDAAAYQKLRDQMREYGAAHVERLHGILRDVPDVFKGQTYEVFRVSGVPRVALCIEGHLSIKHPGPSDRIGAMAWSLSDSGFVGFPFDIGLKDWEPRLAAGAALLTKNHPKVLFDFDEVVPRVMNARWRPGDFFEYIRKRPC